LHGPTLPQECGPYGAGHIALQKYHQSGTTRQRRRAANDAMRAITAEMVCEACDQLIAARRAKTTAA
jgi:hypothetical protein